MCSVAGKIEEVVSQRIYQQDKLTKWLQRVFI